MGVRGRAPIRGVVALDEEPDVLVHIAAIATSVALGSVAEAFGVHEIAASTTSHSQPWREGVPSLAIPDAPPLPFIAPSDGPTDQVRGTRLLQQLSLLSAESMRTWAAHHPESIATLLASPPPARDVTQWWQSLTIGVRLDLRSAAPQLIGNLDGIPYAIRDSANRSVLTSTMHSLDGVIATESGRTVVENAKKQLSMLQSISDALGEPGRSTAPRTLMTLDVNGQGRAAIVIGDLATADYVSYLVPGMFFTIENQMGDWVDAASRLHDEEQSWLALLGPGAGTAADAGSTPTIATIAWIGYHTPNLTNVAGLDNAYDGRDSLAHAIEGLQSLRDGDEPYVSVIAHSYGSTAALMALTDYDFQIDALAVVGSPGSPAKSVAELHVRDGNVYVGEAAWDPVPNSSFFGSDPGAKSYGAKLMGVDGGIDAITRQALAASIGHNDYFSPGTESMRNFALIAIGQGAYVTPPR